MTEDDHKDREPTAPDMGKDGVASPAPAEGGDDVVPPNEGSPKG
jgi:hypothetical protein